MSALVPFSFRGDTLDVIPGDGTVHVSIRRVCEALGVDFSGQLQKLKTKPWAGVEFISTPSDGGVQEVACVPLRALPMWLATIEPSRVGESVRVKLAAYQTECADVLARHFLGARAPAAVDAQAIATTAATAALAAVMAALPAMIRGALAEHTADGDGTIGDSRARRLVLGPLRAIADHLSGAERKSREWRSAHRAATNDLRDACRLPIRGRWAAVAARHLGDITSRLATMLAAAERASRKQGDLFSN